MSFWKAPPLRTVTIDVFQRVNGELKTVSHWAKQARGYVARQLLLAHAKQPIGSLDQVAETVSELYEVELIRPRSEERRVGKGWQSGWTTSVHSKFVA